jgi:metallo-beta-lactamase class B
MKRLTGAKIFASEQDARVLESGGKEDFLKWPPETIIYEPAKVDRRLRDGEKVSLGGTTLVANLTPGHTKGATTWTMDVAEDGKTYRVVFFSSASINGGTKLLNNPDYPNIVEDLTNSFAKLKAMPCDIFLAPHGGQFAMADKFERLDRKEQPNPLIDPKGFQQTVAQMERAFQTQLAAEKSASSK